MENLGLYENRGRAGQRSYLTQFKGRVGHWILLFPSQILPTRHVINHWICVNISFALWHEVPRLAKLSQYRTTLVAKSTLSAENVVHFSNKPNSRKVAIIRERRVEKISVRKKISCLTATGILSICLDAYAIRIKDNKSLAPDFSSSGVSIIMTSKFSKRCFQHLSRLTQFQHTRLQLHFQ